MNYVDSIGPLLFVQARTTGRCEACHRWGAPYLQESLCVSKAGAQYSVPTYLHDSGECYERTLARQRAGRERHAAFLVHRAAIHAAWIRRESDREASEALEQARIQVAAREECDS